jgi:plasmid maintenance system antidote protein VapI
MPPKGPKPDYTGATGAAATLAAAIGDESQADAARQLGVSPGFLNHLLRGRKHPGLNLAVKIRDTYGIPVEAWVTQTAAS